MVTDVGEVTGQLGVHIGRGASSPMPDVGRELGSCGLDFHAGEGSVNGTTGCPQEVTLTLRTVFALRGTERLGWIADHTLGV